MVADASRVTQALVLTERVRQMGYRGRLGILCIGRMAKPWLDRFASAEVETQSVCSRFRPLDLPRSGLKLWLPFFFDASRYILMDTDIWIQSPIYFPRFTPGGRRATLVCERELKWKKGKKGISDFHQLMVGKSILQTGVIGISRALWERVFPAIYELMGCDPSEYGDMAAINMFFHSYPDNLKCISEEHCLVLRPSGKGPGTEAHLPYVSVRGGRIHYMDKPVLAIHHTCSEGRVEDFASFVPLLVNNRSFDGESHDAPPHS